jgi:hypothetical protein
VVVCGGFFVDVEAFDCIDSCVFRRTPPPSFDLHKHNGDDEPEVCCICDVNFYVNDS